ncbi:hypothetical protein SAMN04488557_1001 [Hyphomicrobium facile]|uniref:Uncharacterized protein n=1 Tax=Hyphomicrobium facile TaxID=51670 RepID=A0A1I7N1H3_9HYPH|nr:hypothetical protein SAMN04488557_1001 [Hyphomicrobium facile]
MYFKHTVIAAAFACMAASSAARADESSDKMNKDLNMNSGSAAGASTGEQGKTSDRTPGNPSPDRIQGSSKAGAPGTDAGKTPEGTSDRTPSNKSQ